MVLMAIIALASCSKDDALLYSEAPSVYVYNTPDSTDYTFATSAVSKLTDTIRIEFRIIGKSSSADRTIQLEPKAGATAKAGYHYKIGTAVIKANEFSTIVPVYLFRKAGLKDSTVKVSFQVKENADFKLGYADKLDYRLSITDILSKPTIWDGAWAPYFGTYSEIKFRFLLEATGRTNWNSYPFPADSRYISQRAKNALLIYNQQHGDLIDEFGEIVTFPN